MRISDWSSDVCSSDLGRHAVLAALANPDRRVKRIWGTREALSQLDLPPAVPVAYADVTDLARLVARDAPHQGLVIEADPLDSRLLADILKDEMDAGSKRPIIVQIGRAACRERGCQDV